MAGVQGGLCGFLSGSWGGGGGSHRVEHPGRCIICLDSSFRDWNWLLHIGFVEGRPSSFIDKRFTSRWRPKEEEGFASLYFLMSHHIYYICCCFRFEPSFPFGRIFPYSGRERGFGETDVCFGPVEKKKKKINRSGNSLSQTASL